MEEWLVGQRKYENARENRARRISRALAYFVSPNEGLLVVQEISGSTKKS